MEQRGIKKLLYSDIYLLVLALSTFVFWHFHLDVVGMCVFASIFVVIMCTMKDATPAIPTILWLMFIISQKYDKKFIQDNLVTLIVLVVLVVVSVVVYFLRNKVKFVLGKQFWGFFALSVALLIGGITYDISLTFKSIPSVLSLAVCMLGTYVFFNNAIKSSNPKYFAKIMLYTGIILGLQTFTYYLTSNYDITTLINFKLLDLGWGVSNSIGFLLLLTIPFTLYLVTKSKMPIFYLIAFLFESITLLLTISRGSILMAALGLPILLIFTCVKAESKKIVTGFFVYAMVMILIGIVVFWDKITLILERITITSSSGRVDLYKEAIADFLKSPLFGISMKGRDPVSEINVFNVRWYHSTIFQYAANAGVVGIGAYIFHVILKYKMFFAKSDVINKFIVVAVLMWSGYSMIDIGYFIEYQLIFLALTLVFAEKNVYNNMIREEKGKKEDKINE